MSISDKLTVNMQKREEPTSLKAAWELMEMFYADKLSQPWLPERFIDWLAVSLSPPLSVEYICYQLVVLSIIMMSLLTW